MKETYNNDLFSLFEMIQSLKKVIFDLEESEEILDIELSEILNKEHILDRLNDFELKLNIEFKELEDAKEYKSKCTTCGSNDGKKKTCCKLVWYCSIECQRKDWSKHKENCLCEKKTKKLKNKCMVCGFNDKKTKTCCYLASAWYCSKECQIKHWPEHKKECLYEKNNVYTKKNNIYMKKNNINI